MNVLQRGLFVILTEKHGLELGDGGYAGLLIGAYLLCLVSGYLLGSINSAVVTSRILYRDDVRNYGSKNAGLTNMFRVYGARGALPTLVGDILKAVVAVLLGALLMGFGYVGGFALGGDANLSFGVYISAIACVFGHVWPIFYRFKGGKGVLCSFISVLMLCPWIALLMLLIFILIVWATKYISLGSITAAALYPIFLAPLFRAFFEGVAAPPFHITVFSLAIAVLVIYCHRANIKRLWNREESKFSFHRKSAPPAPAEERDDHNERS